MVDFHTSKFKDIPAIDNQELNIANYDYTYTVFNDYDNELDLLSLEMDNYIVSIKSNMISTESVKDYIIKLKHILISLLDKIHYYINRIILAIESGFTYVHDVLTKLEKMLTNPKYPRDMVYYSFVPSDYKTKFPNLLVFNNNIDDGMEYILKNVVNYVYKYLETILEGNIYYLIDRDNNNIVYCNNGISYGYKDNTLIPYTLQEITLRENKLTNKEVIDTIKRIREYNKYCLNFNKLGYSLKKKTKNIIKNIELSNKNEIELNNLITHYQNVGINIPTNILRMYSTLSKEMTLYIRNLVLRMGNTNKPSWRMELPKGYGMLGYSPLIKGML